MAMSREFTNSERKNNATCQLCSTGDVWIHPSGAADLLDTHANTLTQAHTYARMCRQTHSFPPAVHCLLEVCSTHRHMLTQRESHTHKTHRHSHKHTRTHPQLASGWRHFWSETVLLFCIFASLAKRLIQAPKMRRGDNSVYPTRSHPLPCSITGSTLGLNEACEPLSEWAKPILSVIWWHNLLVTQCGS